MVAAYSAAESINARNSVSLDAVADRTVASRARMPAIAGAALAKMAAAFTGSFIMRWFKSDLSIPASCSSRRVASGIDNDRTATRFGSFGEVMANPDQ
jgi:hypothetical protein